MVSCVYINVDIEHLADDILVPDHHILPISRYFLHEEMYRVFLYDDTVVVLGGGENKNPMNANDKSYLIDGK